MKSKIPLCAGGVFKSLLSCMWLIFTPAPRCCRGLGKGSRVFLSGLARVGAGAGPARRQAPPSSLAREDQQSSPGVSGPGLPRSSASASSHFLWYFCLQKSPKTWPLNWLFLYWLKNCPGTSLCESWVRLSPHCLLVCFEGPPTTVNGSMEKVTVLVLDLTPALSSCIKLVVKSL